MATNETFLEKMQRMQAEGEAKRLAQLASRTPEEIAHEQAVRQIQIETAQARRSEPSEEEKAQLEKVRARNAEIARIADEGE